MRAYYTTKQIKELAETGRIAVFYNSRGWRATAKEVIAEQNGECQLCKARGRYSRATTAHHVLHLRERPDLAYSKYYTDADGVQHRQLLAVCRACHEAEHGRGFAPRTAKFTNPERW